ncbi:MAG: TRAP transporter large permease [Alphaproteobacteria bacterium]|nr:TRAP transporter large permease [Alphaproteobacteria bacterium]
MMLLLLIGATLLLIALGMEIAWAIGVACLFYLAMSEFTDNPVPYVLFPQQMMDGVDSFSLLAIPLFMFAGHLMTAAGVTERLVRFASAFVGHLHGGLANVGVTTNFVMSGMSGSAIADAAATGSVLIPEMRKKGYPTAFSCAVIASASTVGPIIPPSISFVLLGAIVNLSVGKLFLGGVIPGILMFLAMFVLTWWLARRRNLPRERRATAADRWEALWGALLPLAAPLVVIRSMVVGIATPTEAAAILVLYVLALGLFIFRTLTLRRILHCACSAAAVTTVIMLTVGTSQMFTWLSVQEQFGPALRDAMLSISDNVYVLLLLTNIVLLVLGTFMEPLPLMLVLAPVLFPLFGELGVDAIHLGVIMTINLILGLLTPPVGLILSVVCVIGRVEVMAVFRDAMPYMIVLVGVLLLVTYVPAVVTWLPNYMMP